MLPAEFRRAAGAGRCRTGIRCGHLTYSPSICPRGGCSSPLAPGGRLAFNTQAPDAFAAQVGCFTAALSGSSKGPQAVFATAATTGTHLTAAATTAAAAVTAVHRRGPRDLAHAASRRRCAHRIVCAVGADAGGAAGAGVPPPAGPGPGAGAAGVTTAAVESVPRVEEPSTALLLAWFGCGNRSLFAAQCLLEVLLELYREGRTFGELQLSLKMATQSARARPRRASPAGGDGEGAGSEEGEGQQAEEVVVPPLLQGQEEDVLVSWMALVFLTLEELGVPRDREPPEQGLLRRQREALDAQREQQQRAGGQQQDGPALGPSVGMGGSSMAAGSTYLRGMLGYVRQTLGMYDEGQTLARVAGLQGLVQQSSGAASSPFLVLMQQYTRLVLLTVEVVAASGLPTTRPLSPPETVLQPSGYSQAFSGSCNALDLDGAPGDASAAAAVQECPPRGLAVRLLMAFMGAVLGSLWSLEKFVDAVRVAYDQGLAADELFSQLNEQEFVQSGGLLPIAGTSAASPPPQPGGGASGGSAPAQPPAAAAEATPPPAAEYQITKQLLSTWISLSYMSLAQLGVPYPAAGQRLGWAWAGFGEPIEALGMNDFVGNALRQMAGADPRVVPQPDPQTLAQPQTFADADGGPDPGSGPSAAGSGGAQPAAGPTRRRDSALMVRMEDETLPATSTAFRVLAQQVALVQAVCRQVMGEAED